MLASQSVSPGSNQPASLSRQELEQTPAMKRSKGEGSKPRRIVWDEANLEENERIKKTLSTVKINEPKTPYYGPISEDHEMMSEELQPLDLGNGALLQQAAGILAAGEQQQQQPGSDHDASDHSHRPSSSHSSGFSSDGELQVRAASAPRICTHTIM
jgi:hypothetical protein